MGHGELRCIAEPPQLGVVAFLELRAGLADEIGIQMIAGADRCGTLYDPDDLVGLFDHPAPLFDPEPLDDRDQLLHAREAVPGIPGQVGGGEERLSVGRHDDGERPAAAAGHDLAGLHVDVVDVGKFLAVHLHVDEGVIHEGCHLLVLEGFMGHHVAPVARGVADGQEDGLVFRPCPVEGLLPPGVPVHGVVRVLEKVRACLAGETIAHGRHLLVFDSVGAWCVRIKALRSGGPRERILSGNRAGRCRPCGRPQAPLRIPQPRSSGRCADRPRPCSTGGTGP